MREFAALYEELDASTATGDKVAALSGYLARAAPDDAAWAVYFLAGGKPRQLVPTAVLRDTACRLAGVDDWLFDECYQAVGDLAETVALILPPAQGCAALGLANWMQERLLPLRGLSPQEQSQRLAAYWGELDAAGRFLLVKLIGGGFRVGVSKLLVQRALAACTGLDARLLAQRLVGLDRRAPHAERRPLAGPGGCGWRQRRPLRAALSLLPGPCTAGRTAVAGRLAGLAGGVEVRRHPRADRQTCGPMLDLVARRGTGQRAFPGSPGTGRVLARRHGARRRTAGLACRQRNAEQLQDASAAHHAQDLAAQAAGGRTGAVCRLRPAGTGGARPACFAAGRTPSPPRVLVA